MSTPDFERLTYYELLGVPRNASTDEIKRAFRREMSKYHPDRFAQAAPEEQRYAVRRSQRLTEAYATLSDFSARLNYNRSLAAEPLSPARDQQAPSERPSTPDIAQSPQRDQQADLYARARAHMQAGRNTEALALLRQLERQNPFYRDIADLIARLEPRTRARPAPAGGRPAPLLLGAGALGGAALIILVLWAVGTRENPTPTNASGLPTPALAEVATFTSTPTPSPTPTPTNTPQPTATPMPEPTRTTAPTATASPSPSPSPLPTPEPTPLPIVTLEQGRLIFGDTFDESGWAEASGEGWSVGYAEARYRISVAPGYGSIWSYRTAPDGDLSIAADVQTQGGEAGLLLRFAGAGNYLSFEIDPRNQGYRLVQYSNSEEIVLLSGRSDAIRSGGAAINRLVAELRGERVALFVNGQALDNATAAGSGISGRFGLIAAAGAAATEAFFDNVAVRTVE
jgi:DnaJ-domain-containing protein 1